MAVKCVEACLTVFALAVFAVRCPAEDSIGGDVVGGIKHASVHGQVLDPEGRPCPNARVVLRVASNNESSGDQVGVFDPGDVLAEVRADDTGRFAISDAPIDATLPDVVEPLERGQRSLDVVAMSDGFGLGWTPIYGFPSAGEIKITLQPAAVLEGKVEDDMGTALDGAVVKVLAVARLGSQDDPLHERAGQLHLVYSEIAPLAKADAEGRFRFENLPADHYISVWAYHRDHPPSYFVVAVGPQATSQPLERRLGNGVRETPVQVNPVKLMLRRGPRVRVHVVDPDGKPAGGGRVSLVAWFGRRKWQEDELSSDDVIGWAAQATGPYRAIYVPPPGRGGFCLSYGFSLLNSEFETPKEVRLVLPVARELSGRVVGEGTGRGLAGVTVIWSSTTFDGDWSDAASSKAVTDREGRFRASVLAGKGRIKLLGNAPGYFIENHRRQRRAEPGEYRYAVDVPQEGPIIPLVLEVPRGLTVGGKVADASGAAAKGIVVAASKDAHIRAHAARAVTDAEGKFEMSGLDPRDDFQLSAIDDGRAGFAIAKGESTLPWNESRAVETTITIAPTVTLAGRVLLAGTPQPGVRLTLTLRHDFKEIGGPSQGDKRQPRAFTSQSTELQTVLTDAEGRYRLGGLRGGDSYSIEVEPPFPAIDASWPHQSPQIPKLPENVQGEAKLPDMNLRRLNQSLAGVVIDPDGKPVAGAQVSAMLRNGYTSVSRTSRSGPLPWTETDADGQFRLDQLPDEPLSLMAYIKHGGGGRIRFPARVKVEMNQRDIRIVLDPLLVDEEE